MEEVKPNDIFINDKDISITYTNGSVGGQHVNKNKNCVNLLHKPSGIKVRCNGRSRRMNEDNAFAILRSRLKIINQEKINNSRDKKRRNQIGSGMRGDKIRTIRVRDNKVVDHQLNRTTTYSKYVKGDLSDFGV